MRGSITSASIGLLSFRGPRSPTPGTSMISFGSANWRSAQPWRTLSSSASFVGVRNVIAMSFVTWSPAIGITAVWRIAPPANTAMSVVPPPMSIRQTPRSFSSSFSTAFAEASGCSITSRTSSPQRRTHFVMFSTADTEPVTIWTFTSRRTPLMPRGSRTSSCPSMMNSCGRMCSTCWSFGIAIAFAVSTTRSMSACVTSFSLIATMPLELRLLMWLPAMPVTTSLIRQSAISSASSSTRWIDAIVASMLTTTPFLSPRDGCVPRPMMLRPPSGITSATIATIFDVPMSRPTIRLLLSFTIPLSCPSGGLARRLFVKARHAHREAVAIAQVDVVHAGSCTREHADGAPVHGEKTPEPAGDIVATDIERQRRAVVLRTQLPAASGGKCYARQVQRERREQGAPLAIARAHQRGLRVGPVELRQFAGVIRGEHIAVRIDERMVVPARERLVLVDFDFEAARPLAAQRHCAHPWHTPERRARIVEVHREERAGQLAADHRREMRAAGAHERRRHDDFTEVERGKPREPADQRPCEEGGGDDGQRDRNRVQLPRVIPHGRLRGFRRKDRETTCPPVSPPSAPDCGRSSRETCSPRGTR